MPEMVALEKVFCRSAPWRWWTRRYVMPWALQGVSPSGRALEIGAGGGIMATAMLDRFPDLELVVTDYDGAMLAAGQRFLERFGPRANLEIADATSLGFADHSFDYVFSFIMLHHVVEWEKAFAEALRVLRPGGWLLGYDLLDNRMFRGLHRLERAKVRSMTLPELDSVLSDLPVSRAVLTGRGSLLRFRIQKGQRPEG